MLRKLCISAIGLVLATVAFAQTPLAPLVTIEQRYDSLYQTQTVIMYHSFWSGSKLYLNEIEYPLKHMSSIAKPYPSVMAEYNDFASSRKKKNIFMPISSIIYGVSIAVLLKDNPQSSDYGLSFSLLCTSLIGFIIGGLYENSAINHMEKTVWLYNREIIRPYATSPDSMK